MLGLQHLLVLLDGQDCLSFILLSLLRIPSFTLSGRSFFINNCFSKPVPMNQHHVGIVVLPQFHFWCCCVPIED